MKKLNLTNQKENTGITLIALVVTIIVLLILAGISIATLTGENGLLTKANTAKEQTEIADAKEQAKIDITAEIAERIEAGRSIDLRDSDIQQILTGKEYVSKEEGQPGKNSFKTRKSGYEIPYSDLYKGTTSSGGKTISDLYDGNNDWTDTDYNSYISENISQKAWQITGNKLKEAMVKIGGKY